MLHHVSSLFYSANVQLMRSVVLDLADRRPFRSELVRYSCACEDFRSPCARVHAGTGIDEPAPCTK